ncbi:peptidoglycan binding domain-containing protein [Candidatus Gottesmanbacteria bacterium]|nr:peptidoglycan binding domain-containing protein [Candidatus Gottesmanbacteria bacterium]
MVKQKSTHHKAHSHKVEVQQQKPAKNKAFRFVTQTSIWATVFLLVFFIILPLLFLLMFNNRVYPKILIGNINLAGKTVNQATTEIESQYKDIENKTINLTFENQTWETTLSNLGVKVDSSQSAKNALLIGRGDNLTTNVKTLVDAWQNPVSLPVVVSFDDSVYNAFIQKVADEIKIPLVEPSIILDDKTITLVAGRDGRELNYDKLQSQIINWITYQDSNPLTLLVKELKTDISENEQNQTKERAQLLIDKKLTVIISEQYYDVEGQELISLLSFHGGYDLDSISSLSANLATAYDKPPQDAAFNFENGRVTVFRPGKDGQNIDRDKSVLTLDESLISLEATTSAEAKVSVPIVKTAPDISTSEVNSVI